MIAETIKLDYFGYCQCGQQARYLLEFVFGPAPGRTANQDKPKTGCLPLCPACWQLEQEQARGFACPSLVGAVLE